MDPRWEVRRYLRVVRGAWPPEQSERLGLVYRGPADFVLREGRWWGPPVHPLPEGVPDDALPGRCYGNAIAGCVLYGLRYVQGWALGQFGDDEDSASMPVPHAWNADGEGGVIDLTWSSRWIGRPGLAYLGVEFSVERADDATWHGDADVIDDWGRDWPLLREKWRGELAEPDPSWTPSPALRAARARARGDHAEALSLLRLAKEEAWTTS